MSFNIETYEETLPTDEVGFKVAVLRGLPKGQRDVENDVGDACFESFCAPPLMWSFH